MLNNYFILKAQADYLNKTLINNSIEDSVILEKNVFSFILQSEKTRYLKFIFEKNLETFYIEDFHPLPGKNILSVFPSVKNKSIQNIEIMDANRIVRINLSDGISVIFYAIPNKANIFILQGDTIIDCYKDKTDYLDKNINDLLIKPARKSIDEIKTVKDFISTNYSHIGKYYKEELMFRIENEHKSNIPEEVTPIADKFIKTLNNPVRFTLYLKDEEVIPALTTLHKYDDYDKVEYDDINSLIINCYRKTKYLHDKHNIKDNLITAINSNIKRLDNKIKNLSVTILEAKDSQLYKTYGDILLGNMHDIKTEDGYFEYKDENGKELKIKINPLQSIPENANHYYSKYKGLKNSVESLKKKLLLLEKEKVNLNIQKSEIEKEENLKVIRKMNKSETTKNDSEKLPFRIFKLNDKFEVWVGKDSASNDLLTMKHTNQYDLWFHVRGSSGSHTILKYLDKNITPEKELIIKAASIAAYYSKARNGKHIPVAYCEKKYVKKRKGFKQGAVVMEKEKIVFVDPKIPEM